MTDTSPARELPADALPPSEYSDYRVKSVSVMTRGELAAYGSLSLLVVGAIAWFGSFWWSLPDRHDMPWTYGLATLVVAYHLAAWILRWLALPRMRRPLPAPPIADSEPPWRVAVVTTIVPSQESIEMLEQTLAALVKMNGAHDTWVLDEENDAAVRELCSRFGVRHFTRQHRPELRTGEGPLEDRTKHGNYNAWLSVIGYEQYDILVSFDPDHVPESRYLDATLGYFRDPGVGYVQAPQVYYNQGASWIARGAAEETYDFYSAHQMASYGLGHPVVVGCHTAHRITALRQIGGFAAHDADDLLETLEYRSAGWLGVYVPEILALGLTPTSWFSYMRQQVRWARSVVDIKLRALPRLAGKLPLVERLMSVLHGIFYLRPLTIPAVYILLAILIATRRTPEILSARGLLALASLAVTLGLIGFFRQRFYLDETERGIHWRSWVLQFAKWPALVHAAWLAIRGKRPGYALTLKVLVPSGRQLVLWPHIGMASLLAEAWVLAGVLRPPLNITRSVLAAIIVLGSFALAWTELMDYPPAFIPGEYQRVRDRDR